VTTDTDLVDLAAPGTPFVTAIREYSLRDPHTAAIIDGDITITHAELESRTNRLARDYAARGVTFGSFVTIGLPNSAAFLEAMVASWKLGAVPQPVSFRLPPRELAAIVDVVKPSLVVGLDAGDAAASIPLGFEPDPALSDAPLPLQVSPQWKAPTSGGSTGRPKVIVALQPAVVEALIPLMPLLKIKQGGVKLIATPLGHNMAIMWSTATMITGGTAVIMRRFDAEETLELIDKYEVDWVCLVPTMMHRIAQLPAKVRARASLASLIAVATGGSNCTQRLKDFWVDWIGADRMVEFYAGTETQVIVVTDGNGWLAHPSSVGTAVIGQLQVRDADGTVLPDGEVGELWSRRGEGTPTPYRYIGAEPQRDPDGWETLGDMGRLEQGWLYLADRKADMVVIGGSNVYPAEVEGALEEHPLVVSSCVVGIPDDEYGNVLHAFVQTSGEVSDDELVAFLREQLLPYKVPRTFERVDSPIRDDAGKVRRAALRAQAIADRAASTSPVAS
jgi:bile acid-coenzyme A ligase